MQGRKDITVYDEINTYRDKATGEVISDATKKVVRREKTPDFVMMFTQGLSILTKSELTKGQGLTLFEVLKYTVNNSNMLMLNPDVRKTIAADAGLTIRTVGENLKILVKKEILIRKNRTYFLNPLIFGRGNWNDIKKLTQSLEIEYDFENCTAVERIKTKALYHEAEALEDAPHEVVDAEEYKGEDGTLHKIITLEEKEHPNQARLSFEDEVPQTNELDLLKEQNKSKELAIEEMKLKLEMKREGLL